MFRMKNKLLKEGQTKQNLIKNWGTYLILGLAFFALIFFRGVQPASHSKYPRKCSLRRGREITYSEFQREYQNQREQLRQQYKERFDPAVLRLAHRTMDRLVQERILALEARDLGLYVSDERVRKSLLEFPVFREKNGSFSPKLFKQWLRRTGYTERTLQNEIRRGLLVNLFQDFVIQTNFVSRAAVELEYRIAQTKRRIEYLAFDTAKLDLAHTDGDVEEFFKKEGSEKRAKAYYSGHQSDYSKPEQVALRHIIIGYKEARAASADALKREKSQAEALAKSVLKKLKRAPSNFTKLAKLHTDDPAGKESGGEMGYVTRETLTKEVTDVAFKLAKNGISDVIASPFGYHIVQVVDKRAAVETSYEQARSDIAKILLTRDRGPRVAEKRANEVLKQLKAGKSVNDLRKKYAVEWKTTSEFPANGRFISGLGANRAILDAAFSLSKKGEVAQKVLRSGKVRYVIRLKDIKQPDMTKLQDLEMQMLKSRLGYEQGQQFLLALRNNARSRLEEQKAIYLNSSYLALDNPN